MVMIAICSSLIGAVLGTRLKVLVLVPAILLGLALVLGVAAINGSPASWTFAAAAILAICLQLGYLGGLLTRHCLTLGRVISEQPVRSNFTILE